MKSRRSLLAALGVAATSLCAAAAGAAQTGQGLDVALGKALFERLWVAAPSSTAAADGLGPLFNQRACAGCHQDGGAARFTRRDDSTRAQGLVVRVAAADGGPHPELGAQIQDRAVPGLAAEARLTVTIRQGALAVQTDLAAGPRQPAIFETRIAPPLTGRAALDDIDDAAVLALADPQDRDGDGISGRAHMVPDDSGAMVLGRFGYKATGASLLRQTAEAAALDMGLSSPLVPQPFGDCTAAQPACRARPSGRGAMADGEEISAAAVERVVAYLASLRPAPADRTTPGFRLFAAAGCAACHVPDLPGRDGRMRQVFSDLLLHDLGAEGASRITAGGAAPGEWRTTPLAGLAPRDGERRYFHDGRAATLRAAIAAHGGEAAAARDAFAGVDGRRQQMILDFLAKL
ncbi:thiol oxidoreductase [Aestuariivirga litoralis]|uniref:Thiol oxidoreductase n=1 Tax=Aestuariivirga litoralis TaxID=2650924 RepID=A0A2W2B5E4_9HYPH|nr:di-heme oxidoredictase family protein [Aestuariivirga litoralis]PZF75338.1 thiol oxidoreductase [Aestuariivirga litoralis]